jgi:uncharacterized protein GlcG (DUF336 family)
MFRRPSAAFEAAIRGGRSAVLGLPGVTPVTGGLPIMSAGKVVGEVGVIVQYITSLEQFS